LDALPRKYAGLDGTELAISESQERMAVVVDATDAEAFIARAAAENLEAVVAARITDENRLVMRWRGEKIVDISRDFLNTNGAEKHASVKVPRHGPACPPGAGGTEADFEARLISLVSGLNACGKRGLYERFDSTIGAGTVLAPAGGAYQLTPAQCMAAKLPVEGETDTCAGMAFGFDPYLAAANPYEGAYLAVLESVARLVAAGFPLDNAYLSLQEYFPRTGNSAECWGLPFAALLGALQAQLDFGIAAIGGKDSMSGTFENPDTSACLDVPPSLVSFAVSHGPADSITGGEFKKAGREVIWIKPAKQGAGLAAPESFNAALRLAERLIAEKKAVSVYVAGCGGAAEALFKMSSGNRIGVEFEDSLPVDALFEYAAGSFLAEIDGTARDIEGGTDGVLVETLGKTIPAYTFVIGKMTVNLEKVQRAWESKLESVFPVQDGSGGNKGNAEIPRFDYRAGRPARPAALAAKPRALIPVFPGTNCEYDTARALRAAGAEAEIFVVRNLTPALVADSAAALANRIDAANMLVIPGGFSGGDEPDGSAKLIAAFFRGSRVADAVMRLLEARDGLILGICNGFQALIKLGLVPFGRIKEMAAGDPTLTFNTIGRHQSRLVRARICSTLSPWFLCEALGAVHTIPVSHGEGRFVADEAAILRLAKAGQIAAQYAGLDDNPSMDLRCNPAGSMMAVEALTDPTGRILGKMAHSERQGANLYKNIPHGRAQRLFEGGVKYFTG
ncbi:MAG: phosphoribosylformylglycinamidine synthase subunit PurQ, partial [Spirochaetaceae bacterium]|nr:phosphoribosylformylglycinamidine synthase subunit PurQ [Spirochaetaceae bacterium]